MPRSPFLLSPDLSGFRLSTDDCGRGHLCSMPGARGWPPRSPVPGDLAEPWAGSPTVSGVDTREPPLAGGFSLSRPQHAQCSVGNSLAQFSAILTPGRDANWLKPIGAFDPSPSDWSVLGLDPFTKPMNTNVCWGTGRSKVSPPLGGRRQRQTPGLARATMGSLGTSQVGRRQRPTPPSQFSEMLDGTQLGKPTSGCFKQRADDFLVLLKMVDSCRHDCWFTFASRFPSPGPAFLIC